MSPDDQYYMLVDSLRLVAASSEEQVAALPDFVCVTDEVVMTFSDAYLLVPQLQRAGLVSDTAAMALKRLDDFFEGRRPSECLAVESLASHPYWGDARVLAAEALRLMGEEQLPPARPGAQWGQS